MKVLLKLFFVFNTFIFLSSCVSSSLLPQTQNVPLFTKEKELQISTQITGRSAELQLAYSAKPHLAFMANGLAGNLQMVELGAGYYTKLSEKFIFESYAGIGEGSVNVKNTFYHIKPLFFSTTKEERCNINIFGTKFFIQPNIGYKYEENLQLSLSLKGSFWYFPKYYYYNELWRPDIHGEMEYIKTDSVNLKNTQCYTLEPAITFKTGGERLKFMTQLGFLAAINSENRTIRPLQNINNLTFTGKNGYSYFFIRLGMTFNFGVGKSQK